MSQMPSDSTLISLFLKFVRSKSNILSPADDVTEFSKSGGLIETDLEEISDQCLLQAPLTVRYFYDYIIRNSIINDATKYPDSKEKSAEYIKRMCNDVSWFGRPTIFERCFTTISFVLTCSEYTEEAFSDIKRNVRVSWPEYFSSYTEEFNNEGGWKRLKTIAYSYAKVHDFIRIVNPAQDSLDFIKLSKSVENYMYFCLIREFISEDKKKSKVFEGVKIEYSNKCKTCASLWIKFIIKNGSSDSFDVSFTPPPREPLEVTCILRALRNFCDPYGFKADHSKLSSDSGLSQKSSDPAICSPGRNPESCTKKENHRKGEPQDTHMNSNFNEAVGQEYSNSIIRNASQENIADEKKCEDKDSNIENFTGGEKDGTDNGGWRLQKRNRKKNLSSDQSCNKSSERCEEMKQASLKSVINNVPLQNTAIEKERKDSSKLNFAKGQNDKMNAPPTSSTAGGKTGKSKKRKNNKGKRKPRVNNKNLKPSKDSSSTTPSDPLQNTAAEKALKDSRRKDFTGGENEGMNNLPCTSSMDRKSQGKTNLRNNGMKAGLKVSDKSLNIKETTRHETSDSMNNNVPQLQNTAIEKERDNGNRENVAGDEDDLSNRVFKICFTH